MREIKFRGKQADNGEWICGHLIGEDVIVGKIVEFTDEYFCTEFWYKVVPETVVPYTGLKDKNGKEIYEDDIMRVPDLYEAPENTEMNYHNEVVRVKGYAFCLGSDPFYEDCDYITEECEVIGNIWDNPNLVEGRESIPKEDTP